MGPVRSGKAAAALGGYGLCLRGAARTIGGMRGRGKRFEPCAGVVNPAKAQGSRVVKLRLILALLLTLEQWGCGTLRNLFVHPEPYGGSQSGK